MALFEIDLLQIFLGSRQELKRFFIRRVQCSETAADLVQEVYLRLPLLTPPRRRLKTAPIRRPCRR